METINKMGAFTEGLSNPAKITEDEILVKSIYYPEGVAVHKSKILEFVKPILGFDYLKKYCILNINKDKNIPFYILQSLENEKLCFIVTDPNYYFKDYSVAVSSEEKDILNISSNQDVIILVIVNAAKDFISSTVNLKGPLLINTKNNRALQMVIANEMFSARQKLPIAKPAD